MMEPVKHSCKYCDDYHTIADDIPIRSNCNLSRCMCLIVQGARQKELVMSINGEAYGIEIDYCPKCGRKLSKWSYK